MKAELITLTPEEIIASFNDAEREVYEELRSLIHTTTIQEIEGRYNVAVKIYKIYQEAKAEKSLYGSQFLKRLAIALGLQSEALFREMITIVERWPTLTALREEVLNVVTNVSWKKLLQLTKLDKEEIQEAAAEVSDLSARQLGQIHRTDTPKPGRTPSLINDLNDLLLDIKQRCISLTRKANLSWKVFTLTDEHVKAFNEDDDVYMAWEEAFDALDNLLNVLQELKTSWASTLGGYQKEQEE